MKIFGAGLWDGKKKPYHNWLFSYFAFVLLFLLFALIMTTTAKGIVKEEITKANQESFSTMNTIVQTLKNDLDKLGVRISLDKDIAAALEMNEGANQFWNYREVRKVMDTVLSNYQYIDGIAVYAKDQEIMLSSDGANGMKGVYQEYLPEQVLSADADYEAWKGFMEQTHAQSLYRTYSGDLMYLQTLPIGSPKSNGVLICQVSAGQFDRMFPNMNWGADRELLLLDGEGNIVFESHPALLSEKTKEEIKKMDAGSYTLRQGGQKIVVYLSDDRANLVCVYALPASAFWSGLNSFLGLMILLAVLMGILGILLANIFAKRQYTPVENIMKLIQQSAPTAEKRTNEFDYIQSTLRGILKSAKENEALKKKYQNISFRSAFVKFLREGGNESALSELFFQYNIDFAFPAYAAALLSINDISDYFGTIDFESENEQELMELAITNVFDEMLGTDYQTLAVRMDENMLFCLIGMEEGAFGGAQDKISAAQEFTRDRVGIYYSVLLSEPFAQLEQTGAAYAQTMDLYTWYHGMDRDILVYGDVDWGEGRYEFTLELEKQLLEIIKRGAEDEAKQLLSQVFGQPQAQPGSAQNLKYMKYDMISAFMKLLRSETKELNLPAEEEILVLENATTLDELYQNSVLLIQRLCQSFQTKRQTKETALGDRVMEYVRENFSSVDLNVNKLGEVFHLSSSYLSKTFKQQTGEILRDYILNIRLKNAEFLLQSDLKLEDVARRCGFIDAGTFIRAFKKRYGTTPGKYREQM